MHLKLAGRLDRSDEHVLRARIHAAYDALGDEDLVLDFAAASFADDAIVRVLVELVAEGVDAGRHIKVRNLAPGVLDLREKLDVPAAEQPKATA